MNSQMKRYIGRAQKGSKCRSIYSHGVWGASPALDVDALVKLEVLWTPLFRGFMEFPLITGD